MENRNVVRKACVFFVALFFVLTSLFAVLAFSANNTVYAEEKFGASARAVVTERTDAIHFTSKVNQESVYFRNKLAVYYEDPAFGLTNSCGAVAGGVVMAHYSRNIDLMNGYVPGISLGGGIVYRYNSMTDKAQVVIKELYEDMGTSPTVGVTESEFKSGIAKYVSDRGYSVRFHNVMSGSKIDKAAYKDMINDDIPVVMLVRKFNTSTVMVGANVINFEEDCYVLNHIISTYGIVEYQVKLADGSIKDVVYYNIIDGYNDVARVMHDDDSVDIANAFGIEIY